MKARAGILGTLAALAFASAAVAQTGDGTRRIPTPNAFETLVERVERAVEKNGLGIVAVASASRGAAARELDPVIETIAKDAARPAL